jgi:hypothetical protein
MKMFSQIVLAVVLGAFLVGCSCNTCPQACDKPAADQKCYKGENQ